MASTTTHKTCINPDGSGFSLLDVATGKVVSEHPDRIAALTALTALRFPPNRRRRYIGTYSGGGATG